MSSKDNDESSSNNIELMINDKEVIEEHFN